jgi:Arc/MetJ family transcription regulator
MAARSKTQSGAKDSLARDTAHMGKVRREFWLDPRLLAEAQSVLGTATEHETVELALGLMAFRHGLIEGAQALQGLDIRRID